VLLLFAGCTSTFIATGPGPATGDTGDPVERVPATGDTAPDTVPLTPGTATLDCAATIPEVGKTDCTLRIADADGAVQWEGPAGVGLHGRSSLGFPKPQLAIELRDEAGADTDADLFGMGAESDWLLNGMYVDRALFRNKLAYDLYRELSDGHDWAPESAYVELTANGAYAGLFALVERVDRSDGRLDLPADDGTGRTFIVKADEAGIPSTEQYGSWNIIYPPVSSQTTEVTSGVAAKLARMETLVASRDTTLWDVVDLDSAVAFVLLEETFKNNDAYFLSHHVYTRRDGRLGFVPWDLDLSLGQPSYNDNENPASWIAYRPDLIEGMAQTPGFAERMTEMWLEWRAGALADAVVLGRIDAITAAIGPAAARNFERWPIGDIQFGGYLYAVGSWDEEVTRVRTWLAARLAWMDTNVASYAG
jgi:hypothetical protein